MFQFKNRIEKNLKARQNFSSNTMKTQNNAIKGKKLKKEAMPFLK